MQCTLYIVQWAMHFAVQRSGMQFTDVHTLQCNMQCAYTQMWEGLRRLLPLLCQFWGEGGVLAMCNVHFALCNLRWEMCNGQYAMCNMQCALYSVFMWEGLRRLLPPLCVNSGERCQYCNVQCSMCPYEICNVQCAIYAVYLRYVGGSEASYSLIYVSILGRGRGAP